MTVPRGIVDFLVGNIHVGTPDRDVVRDFYRRLRADRREFHRARRKAVYRYALARHAANRQTYNFVTRRI